MTSNSQQKYRIAISWCEANRHLLKKYAKIRSLTSDNLYLLMETLGMYWSKREGAWLARQNAADGGPVSDVQKVTVSGVSGRTLIRIIAHRTLIEKRVSEFVEFCELLNWRVVKKSDPLGDNGQEFIRVYITVMVDEGLD